jgi:hypothetical protein
VLSVIVLIDYSWVKIKVLVDSNYLQFVYMAHICVVSVFSL